MANFRYTGKNLSGDSVEGVLKARDSEDLEQKLAEKSIFLESYFQQTAGVLQTITGILKKTEITRLTRQMQVLISSGITVLESVESVREQIEDKRLGLVYDQIISSIQSGEALHLAFGKHPAYFDNLYVSLLEAGEISGTLDVSLERIASYRERSESISKKIKSAMAYPALVLLVSIIVIFVLIAYIIPIFSSMYANFGLELPDLTRKVVSLSLFLQDYVWHLIIGMVLIIFVLLSISQTSRFKVLIGRIILKIPVVKSLALKLATARFTRTLGTLLTSGLQLISAVSVATRTIGNKYFEKKLETIPDQLSEGNALAQTLSEIKIFPKTIIRMASAGESTGRLGEMFSKAADFYESEIDTEITTMTSVIEPLIILILGLMVAFILVAMYLPLFDLIGQMGG